MLPKACEIDKHELVKLWTALAFVQPTKIESTEEQGIRCFNDLVARSFFNPYSNVNGKEMYKMHDLIHDLAQSVSSGYCLQVRNNDDPRQVSEKCRHVSLICDAVEQPVAEIVHKSTRVRTLLSPTDCLKNFGQSLNKMFRTCRYIRVLDLSSSTLQVVPESIRNLKLLRYLDLSRTEIKMLPDAICKLHNLQTLKLLKCLCLFELPRGLCSLINLQCLELDQLFWYKCSTLPPRIGKLTSLHDLHAFPVSNQNGIEQLKDLVHLNGTLRISNLQNAVNAGEAKLGEKKMLQNLKLEWSDDRDHVHNSQDEVLLEALKPHSGIEELSVYHYMGTRIPTWMRDGHPRNLTRLSLHHCNNCRALTVGQLPNLGDLSVKGMLELEQWSEEEILSLDRLEISNCPKLVELPADCFLGLRVLKIKRCNSLKALPVTPFLEFLTLVDNPVLGGEWREPYIFTDDEAPLQLSPSEDEPTAHSTNDDSENNGDQIMPSGGSEGEDDEQDQPMLSISVNYRDTRVMSQNLINPQDWSELLELKIIGCPKLETLPSIFFPQKLEISGCDSIKALPIAEQAQRLQVLSLDACQDDTLVQLIPPSPILYSLAISNVLNLASLPTLPDLPELAALHVRGCKDLNSLDEQGSWQNLPNLNTLSIRDCPLLSALPEEALPTTLECLIIRSCPSLQSLGGRGGLKSLAALNDLYIEDCPALQSLPEDGLPASLQHLRIRGCPLVSKRCTTSGEDWQKIKDIPDLEMIETVHSNPHVSCSSSSFSYIPWCGRIM